MSEDIVQIVPTAKKPGKKRKKVKKVLDAEEAARKKDFTTITHKKVTTNSNWQNFMAKKLHIGGPVKKDVETKDENGFKGIFRKHRKPKPIAVVSTTTTASEEVKDISSSLDKTVITGLKKGAKLTRFIAIDCEMVGIDDGRENMLARVSLVNKYGDCLYDKFVKPKEDVIDYRTHVSGVRPVDLKNAESFETVQKEVAEIITGRVLVGHALRNDLRVLYLGHPRKLIRDTSKYKKFRALSKGGTPGLKKLAAALLGVTIQDGEHNSVIDAQATMQLYMLYSKEWEAELRKKKTKPQAETKKPS